MAVVQAEEAVQHAASPRKAERRDEEGREDVIAHQQIHQPDGSGVARQEYQLHQPVHRGVLVGKHPKFNEPGNVGLADVAVARDVDVVVAVGVGPVLQRGIVALVVALKQAQQPDQQSHADAVAQQREKYLQPYMLRRGLGRFRRRGQLIPAPGRHPDGHKAQADPYEEHKAHKRLRAPGKAPRRRRPPVDVERREHEYAAGRDAALDLAVSAQAVRYRMQSTTLPTGILDGHDLQMFLAAPEARTVHCKVKPRRQQYHNTHSQMVHAQRNGKVPGGQSRAQYARVEQFVY